MKQRTRILSGTLTLMVFFAPIACNEDLSEDGGESGLLVPDQEEERRFGDVGQPQGPTEEGSGLPVVDTPEDSTPVVPDRDNPNLTSPPGHSGSTSQCGGVMETEAFKLLNEDRAKHGLSALQCDDDLLIVGRLHCKDMDERQYFAHTNPDGEQPWDRMNRYGIRGWSLVGENIAMGQRSPQEVQTAWMNSPGHRANILTADFTHVGVAFYQREGGRTYWTQLFARF
jgi:uncharacterized protein YkwD